MISDMFAYPRTDRTGDRSAISRMTGMVSSSSKKCKPPSAAAILP